MKWVINEGQKGHTIKTLMIVYFSKSSQKRKTAEKEMRAFWTTSNKLVIYHSISFTSPLDKPGLYLLILPYMLMRTFYKSKFMELDLIAWFFSLSLSLSFFCLFIFSRAALMPYGGSQARGLIRAVAAGLHQSHSNTGSKPHLQPTPQLMATPDP